MRLDHAGIPEAKIPELFKPYSQIGSSVARKHGGTGLGLSIVKSLVEAMHGPFTNSHG